MGNGKKKIRPVKTELTGGNKREKRRKTTKVHVFLRGLRAAEDLFQSDQKTNHREMPEV